MHVELLLEVEIRITSAFMEGPSSFLSWSLTHSSTSFSPAVVSRTARTTRAPALASSLAKNQQSKEHFKIKGFCSRFADSSPARRNVFFSRNEQELGYLTGKETMEFEVQVEKVTLYGKGGQRQIESSYEADLRRSNSVNATKCEMN